MAKTPKEPKNAQPEEGAASQSKPASAAKAEKPKAKAKEKAKPKAKAKPKTDPAPEPEAEQREEFVEEAPPDVPAEAAAPEAEDEDDDEELDVDEAAIEVLSAEIAVPAAPVTPAAPAAAAPGAPPSAPYGRRFKPVKPPLPAGTMEILIARAKYTVRHLSIAIEVERPRKRDPKNPRVYKFSLKGCEVARKHLSGRAVTLADASELLRAVRVPELESLEGEARRQATKFLLVALASRSEAELTRDGDLILVRVPFNAADLA